jgi:hypothetical protein
MKRLVCVGAILGLLAVPAFGDLSISLIVRETAQGGGAFPAGGIGANGGSSGGLEIISMDVQSLVLDGTWQKFTFDLGSLAGVPGGVTAFAGATANGTLEGAYGVIDSVRIKSQGAAPPTTLWIDDIADTTDPNGPPPPGPIDTVFGSYEGVTLGTEHIFQEPSFSGSTSANVLAGSSSLVSDDMAHNGTQSDKIIYEFTDTNPSRWIRLTTFVAGGTPTGGNPAIRFDQASVVSFWMKGVPEPSTLALLGLTSLAIFRRRR